MDSNYLLDIECPPDLVSPEDDANRNLTLTTDENRSLLPLNNRRNPSSKGIATSFGFKKRTVAPSIASNDSAARRLANPTVADDRDRNGNRNEDTDTDTLANNFVGRATSKLPPPKKEASANTKVSRFGFRQSPTDRLHRVADLNSASRPSEFGATVTYKTTIGHHLVSPSGNSRVLSPPANNRVVSSINNRLLSPTGECTGHSRNYNIKQARSRNGHITNVVTSTVTSNSLSSSEHKGSVATATVTSDSRRVVENNNIKVQQSQATKFTLQTTQLPRPACVRMIESKNAKTLANNNKKSSTAHQNQHHEETSSKYGSLTEDSGVGSHSGYIGEHDMITDMGQLDESPTFGVRRRTRPKPRHLEIVATGKDRFDVRDTLNNSNDSIDSAPPPLPQLPSAFASERKCFLPNSGIVRERTNDYQRSMHWDRGRKISATSSDGYSDDHGEEEKTLRDRFKSEKSFLKSNPHKTFLKSRASGKEVNSKADSSPPSSDEHDWVHGGEAMADDISISMSSCSDNRQSDSDTNSIPAQTAIIETVLQTMTPRSAFIGESTKTHQNAKDVKSVLLTIEDPKFAAVASSTTGSLDDEMLSPVDSIISYSETEELLRRKMSRSLSNSKDVNEKLTPPSPGTPTNASNSLSLSDSKDDFLDDEIADQPGLFGEETISNRNDKHCSLESDLSESTPTIKDSTPKPRRKLSSNVESSPLHLRHRKSLQSRTGSLDTLSPCESIASDDLMMDYDVSQSSGLDDCDRQSTGFLSLNETNMSRPELGNVRKNSDRMISSDKWCKSTTPRSRLLSSRSRTGTPSSIPDSPRSLDSRINNRPMAPRPSATSSPFRSRLLSNQSNGYESDDSIRIDKANHTAIKQNLNGIKTMLLKLRGVITEPQIDEDMLLRCETHNPFESQILTNGLFNSICHNGDLENIDSQDNLNEAKIELAELRRQVLFLQGQLDDKDKTVQSLQEQMIQLLSQNYHANSAPASTVAADVDRCNAATQTERIRPISAGPSMLNGSTSFDGGVTSLVSATETPPKHHHLSRITQSSHTKIVTSKLWRKPGEPPSPQRYCSSIPRKARSRNRTQNSKNE